MALMTAPDANEILTAMERGLPRGRIPLSIYGDREIFELELERIFNRCWIFVAHESEVPEPGDFVSRRIGDAPWIVSRDERGAIHVLFDSCRHRGTKLCRVDRGNSAHFQCPYHGWTYKSDGTLTGVPNRRQAFRELNDEEWSLFKAPRVANYRGLIFACLDPNAMSLEEYLGPFSWYLDLHFAIAPGGLEVIGDPHRWIVTANWKSPSENFSGDSYHTQTLHRSIVEVGMRETLNAGSAFDVHVTECNGHATSIRHAAPGVTSFWGDPPDVLSCYSDAALSPAQFDLARKQLTQTGTIFPNLSFIHSRGRNDAVRPGTGFLSLSQWQPLSATQIEVWRWMLVPKDAPAAAKRRSYDVAVATFSSSGNFEQDDTVAWGGTARAAQTTFARKIGAYVNYEMGMPGMSDAKVIEDWPGPGIAYDTNLEDGAQRTFFKHWLDLMQRP